MRRVPCRHGNRGVRVLVAAIVVVAPVSGCSHAEAPTASPPPTATTRPAQVDATPQRRALRVLREWDAARATALARGDRGGLVRLYPPGSGLARADVRLLRRYERRGLRLTTVRHQVVDVDVTVSRPRHVQLTVVDRLAVVGVADSIGQERRLAASQLSRHELRFERHGGGWRLSSAREA